MKFLDEFRNSDLTGKYLQAIKATIRQPWTIMEICGGQTHSILKYGLDQMLPDEITLLHGPGCPVCVTPIELIDMAIGIAGQPNVILCTFGDMMRVPGSDGNLLDARARGNDIRMVYSPLESLKIAENNPDKRIVFFGIGFETTAPTTALALKKAKKNRFDNYFVLSAHVRVPPAIELILSSPENRVQAFLAAGHVCTVMGYREYIPIAENFHVPIVVTGFEPVDILQGICMAINQLERGAAAVENQYSRVVSENGNSMARKLIDEVFETTSRKWRGIGEIAGGGLSIKPDYAAYDAARVFGPVVAKVEESPRCLSGKVLRGLIKPPECPAFAVDCSPANPLGAPMVSAEGACAAYYNYSISRQGPIGG